MAVSASRANANRRWVLILLGAITLAGATLRLWQTRESLWLDELHTAWCATGRLGEVASRAAIGNQAPLYFWLEWFMVRLLGPSELSLRLMSVVTGAALPLVLYDLCRRWGESWGVGLIAAALVAIDPLSIFFATEARPYALVQFLAAIHIGVVAELFSRPNLGLRAAFVVGAALLFYLHYTAALLICAELCFWLIVAAARPATIQYHRTMLLIDLALMSILWLPARDHVYEIFTRRANWSAFVAKIDLEEPWSMFNLLPWSISAVVFSIAITLEAIAQRYRPSNPGNEGQRQTHFRLLALGWFGIPVVAAWLSTAMNLAPVFFPRYLAASAPAALVLTALCIGVLPWRAARYAFGAGVLSLALWTSGIIPQFRTDGRFIGDRKEDWRGAIAWLNKQLAGEKAPILVASGLIEADRLLARHDPLLEDYCLFPVTSLYPLGADRGDLVPLSYRFPSLLQPTDRQRILESGQTWLIGRGPPRWFTGIAGGIMTDLSETKPRARQRSSRNGQGNLHEQRDARPWQRDESMSFGNVHVFHIRRP